MPASTRRFSTAPLQQVADTLTQPSPPGLDALLQKLLHIDGQIDADFTALKKDLTHTRAQLEQETTRSKQLVETSASQAARISALERQLDRVESNAPQRRPPSPQHNHKRNAGPPPCVCTCKENRSNNVLAEPGEHLPTCELKRAVLKDMSTGALCELLEAREEAYRVQQTLVERLKGDNKELKETYDKLWGRYENVSKKRLVEKKSPPRAEGRIEHLSIRLQQAGQDVCNVASQVEEKLQLTAEDVRLLRGRIENSSFRQDVADADADTSQVSTRRERGSVGNSDRTLSMAETFTQKMLNTMDRRSTTIDREQVADENFRLNQAGQELMRTLTLQKQAHERLRATVVELTQELERLEPDKVEEMKKTREQLEAAEVSLEKANAELKQKNVEIDDLKKQLKKVLAEYEAVSIAHSYSNAELSKIRATNRAKVKYDRHPNVVENMHHHHRKNYFR